MLVTLHTSITWRKDKLKIMLNTTPDMLSIYQETLYVDNFSTLPSPILGDFSNKICLFIDAACNNDNFINLLQNMMKACKIDLAQCQLYCIENPLTQAVPIFKSLKPEILICFGIPFQNELMQLHIRNNDILEIANTKILSTANLQLLQTVPAEKTALWQALQKLFKLI